MKVPQICIKMKAIYSILLIILSHQLIADSNFYVTPMTLEFPKVLLTFDGPKKKQERNTFICFGNIPDKLITLTPKKPVSYSTPFAVMERLLYIFQYSEDFNEISEIISPNLTENAREFYTKQISMPRFKTEARKKKIFFVYGYFLDKDKCVVFYSYSTSTKKGHHGCAQFDFVFENGRWYLGDQLCRPSENLCRLASFLSCFPKDIRTDLKITVPPTLENLALLATDLDTISFYNKLAVFYGLTPFQKFIEKRLNE